MLLAPIADRLQGVAELLPAALFAVGLQIVVLVIEVLLILVDGVRNFPVDANGVIDELLALGLEILQRIDPVLLGLERGLDRTDDLAQIADAGVYLGRLLLKFGELRLKLFNRFLLTLTTRAFG